MFDSRLNILKMLSEYEGTPLNSRDMVGLLASGGINVAERTVRYHLKLLEEGGLVEHSGKGGRYITLKGREMVERTFGSEISFVRNHFYNMACLADVDTESGQGTVILSTVLLPIDRLMDALEVLQSVSETSYMIGDRVLVVSAGQSLGGEEVPDGHAVIGVINSATSLGVMIRNAIPAIPAYIGLLEYRDAQVNRFVSIIGLHAVSEDVLSLYLKSGLTDVHSSLNDERGRLIGMFFEMPSACYEPIRKLAAFHDLVNVMELGLPGTRLLEVPLEPSRVGVVLGDGLNALALLKEHKIIADTNIRMTACNYNDMLPVQDARKKYEVRGAGNVQRTR